MDDNGVVKLVYSLPHHQGFLPLTPPASPPGHLGKELQESNNRLLGQQLRQRCDKFKHWQSCCYVEAHCCCLQEEPNANALSHMQSCCDSDATQSSVFSSSSSEDDLIGQRDRQCVLWANCLQARQRYRRAWLQRQIERTKRLIASRRGGSWRLKDALIDKTQRPSAQQIAICQRLVSQVCGETSVEPQTSSGSHCGDTDSSEEDVRRDSKSKRATGSRRRGRRRMRGRGRRRVRRRIGDYKCDDFVALGRLLPTRYGSEKSAEEENQVEPVPVPTWKENLIVPVVDPVCHVDATTDEDDCKSGFGLDDEYFKNLHVPYEMEERKELDLSDSPDEQPTRRRRQRRVSFWPFVRDLEENKEGPL